MAKRRKSGICVYCGQKRQLTRDHIPPKNLFPEPRPSNLITVPSCRECNSKAQKDDEYFRLVIVMRNGVKDHSEAYRAWETVFRSLQRPQATGLRISLLESIRPIMVRTQSGLYVGKRPAYDVNIERLNCIITRVVQGLFFHEKGYRLPDTHEAFALMDPTVKLEEPVVKVLEALYDRPPKEIGSGVFSYRYLFAEDDPDSSFWLFIFYEKLFSVGMTLRRLGTSAQ